MVEEGIKYGGDEEEQDEGGVQDEEEEQDEGGVQDEEEEQDEGGVQDEEVETHEQGDHEQESTGDFGEELTQTIEHIQEEPIEEHPEKKTIFE